MRLYHLLSTNDFRVFSQTRLYEPEGLGREGFIHLCLAGQLEGVAERYYSNFKTLYLLAFDQSDLAPKLKWESGFPHYYGPIETRWLKDKLLWKKDESGKFLYPKVWEHYRV